jgi:hypothetical protein
MGAFLAGIVPISVAVLMGLQAQEIHLISGELPVAEHIDTAQLVWTACLLGFAAACAGGTVLTVWAQRRLRARIDEQLAFCEALVRGDDLPQLPTPTGQGTLAKMDRRLQELATELKSRDEALRRDARSERVHTRLARAMAMTDDEDEVLVLTSMALGAFLPDADAEVLIADSSMAHMGRVLEQGQAPGCAVQSPGSATRCDAAALRSSTTAARSMRAPSCAAGAR